MAEADSTLPEHLELKLERKELLRYGENPHQKVALYLDPNDARAGAARARKLQGKELSFNNLQDADAAYECVAEFSDPAVVIVKHMNPCGVSSADIPREAYLRALACDPVSAFGGIVALNRPLDAAVAEELVRIFLEVIIAPSVDESARRILGTKPGVRVLATDSVPDPSAEGIQMRSIAGGYLVQSRDSKVVNESPKVVSKRTPTEHELRDLMFAVRVVKHVKSNAIVFAKDSVTLGIGAGQMSRIYSAKVAALKADEANLSLVGSVMTSDAFFPFADVVEAAHNAGATAIAQPGGSLKDRESIDAADSYGMAMIFTGVRHFRH